MSILTFLAKRLAARVARQTSVWSSKPKETQEKVLSQLISEGTKTAFGKDHGFEKILDYEAFRSSVPIRSYEDFTGYIERITGGEDNVLWPGKPLYYSKTSGTTSGTKYIPVTSESIKNQLRCARNALLLYVHRTGNASFLNGKMIFLSGSPELGSHGAIPSGRLSGIVNHHVPAYLHKNRLPSYETNCISDWEKKVDAIVEETRSQDMRLISGIPPWVLMYFDRLEQVTKKKAGNLFPNFSLFVHGGVQFEPYRNVLEKSLGRRVDTLETYPASEGFIAFQDKKEDDGLLLVLNEGIFYEFIPATEINNPKPTRIPVWEVKKDVNYAIILNTNAGLWGYCIGDIVKFVSTSPYRLVVTGRVKHFISAFGEHVIGEEVEKALLIASKATGAEVVEFTVAPQVSPPEGGLPYHEWFVEFLSPPKDLNAFSSLLDENMQKQNSYYRDLLQGSVLRRLELRSLPSGSFIEYMKSKGKLGGQNKVPHLGNDRTMVEELLLLKSR